VSNTKLLNTKKLIESISLRSMLPSTQNTFLEKDFLYFINEEMDLGLIPHVMMYNEDYFLFTESIPLVTGVNRYTIPSRAIGTKLRDICYNDGTNLSEMTRISVEDLVDNWTNLYSSNLRSFYIEGDEIVIPNVSVTGSINISYYIRPNSMVSEDDVCTVMSMNRKNGLVTVDKYPEKFIDVKSFDITSSKSSFRLVSKEIIPDGVVSDSNLNFTFGTIKKLSFVMPSFASVTGSSYISIIDDSQAISQQNVFWFDKTGSDIAPVIPGANLYRVDISTAVTVADIINSLSSMFNSSFSDNRLILQPITTSSFSIENGGPGISVGDNFSVTSSLVLTESVILAGAVTIPARLNVNDVIALPEETTIPQIPIELHSMLAQRASMRCLEALGDTAGLQAAAAKLVDMESKTGALIDNRVESAPIKISPRHTPIKRATSSTPRRR
jgi:hypothetical protein